MGTKRKELAGFLKSVLSDVENMNVKMVGHSHNQFDIDISVDFDDEEPKIMNAEQYLKTVEPFSVSLLSEVIKMAFYVGGQETHKRYKPLIDELERRDKLRGIETTQDDCGELLNLIID